MKIRKKTITITITSAPDEQVAVSFNDDPPQLMSGSNEVVYNHIGEHLASLELVEPETLLWRVTAHGRKAGAIGITYALPNREVMASDLKEAQDLARAAYYADGYEHLTITGAVLAQQGGG